MPVEPQRNFVTLHLFEFNVSERKWSQEPVTSTFLIEQVPLGAGTFREAYKSRQLGRGLDGVQHVVKRYKTTMIPNVTRKGTLTLEAATLKHVQMHMFARNYVKLLKQEAPSQYGQHLVMSKAYFATSTKAECLFVVLLCRTRRVYALPTYQLEAAENGLWWPLRIQTSRHLLH